MNSSADVAVEVAKGVNVRIQCVNPDLLGCGRNRQRCDSIAGSCCAG